MKTNIKTNITLKIDRALLRRAKVLAAERDTSVSASESYAKAKRSALARLKHGYDLGYKPPASRDEFYEG
jgi:hypothetical protein